MVPPTKRQRVGPAPAPAPFDNLDDDPEADELNERPEDVNARRDPAARLERSRAFAAFKLKSAFENIFEKYERDFTGIGDEIDLRTGEIVVNNGHIESLTTAQLTIGRGDGEDSGGDGASDAGSLNEEEQMLRGKVDVRLSRLGQHALPSSVSTPPHFGAPPFFAAGTPLGIPGMLQPGQMQFGGFPTQYRSPIPLPAADPTWSTPELPSPFLRHALTFGKATPVVRKARLSLSTAREHDGADEDDIFLGGSASSQGKENSGQVSVKKKVLLARPKPEVGSAKKKSQAASAGSKESPRLAKRPKGSLGRKRAAPGTPTAPNSSSAARDEGRGTASASKPTKRRGRRVTSPSVISGNPVERSIGDAASGENESQPLQPRKRGSNHELDPEDSDVHLDLSGDEQKLSRKPRNQTLRVDLPGRKPPDSASFQVVFPEPSEAEFPPQETVGQDVPFTSEAVLGGDTALKSGNPAPAVAAEVFSRNLVDPAYAFSDEDEPTLPKARAPKPKQTKPKSPKATSPEHEALREISPNLGLQGPNDQGQQAADEPPQPAEEPSTTRTPAVRRRVSLRQPKRQEIPETSPYVRPAASSPPASEPPAAAPSEIPESDPILLDEQAEDVPVALNGAPSPTLTDPISKPDSAPLLPSPSPTKQQPPPPPPPHTPSKKPNPQTRRKSHHPPPSPAPKPTPTTTTTPQRRGILSLLPFNPSAPGAADAYDFEEDELSFLTPLKPRSTVARTTPASHHVRLGLLVPGASAAPSSSSASAKLRRVVARAAGKATPTAASNSNSNTPATVGSQGNKKRKRKSGPGLGPGLGPSTPSNDRRFALAAEEELVQTPGGTMRRCGENGFRCAREFCFSCL